MSPLHILCVMAITSLVSCVALPHYQTLTGTVTGRVVDGMGKPVPGATIEYLHRSHTVLRTTHTDKAGVFRFGPFRQWFYVMYIGSPGVWPFPHTLENLGLPNVLRVRHQQNTALLLLGTPATFAAETSQLPKGLRAQIPKQARWTGDASTGVNLVITSDMHDRLLPVRKHTP